MSKADTRVDDLRKAILQLSEWMEQDPKLDMMHQLAIENGIQMLQIVYLSWEKRPVQTLAGKSREYLWLKGYEERFCPLLVIPQK